MRILLTFFLILVFAFAVAATLVYHEIAVRAEKLCSLGIEKGCHILYETSPLNLFYHRPQPANEIFLPAIQSP